MTDVGLGRLLLQKFQDARAKNPAYSLRAYAKKLGMDSGSLSAVLRGRRRLSHQKMHALLDRLGIGPMERAKILAELDGLTPASGTSDTPDLHLDEDRYQMISDWAHAAVLSLINTVDFQDDPHWIAGRLGIPPKRAAEVVERLIRLGILQRTRRKLLPSLSRVMTSDGVPSSALRRAHHLNLDLAGRALDEVPVALRDFFSLTIAVEPARLSELKADVRKFFREMNEKYDSLKGREVYRVCSQVFPLTKLNGGEA